MSLESPNGHKHYYSYFKRLVRIQHLEFDNALQQILWVLINPKKVFRTHKDRNATRGYYARDDPAILLLVLLYLAVSTIGYTLWLGLRWRFFLAILWVLLGDCLVNGAVVASIMWLVSNKLLRSKESSAKPVEWAYCFDVHLNAFIPYALLVYGIQMILWPLMSSGNIVSVMITNTLWLMVLVHYLYLTVLGYTILPSMSGTTGMLGLSVPLALLYVLSIPFKWNAAAIFGHMLASRCGKS